MKMLTTLASVATILVSGWMTVMYFALRHPGYQWRAAISAMIGLGAAALVTGRPAAALRIPIALWGAALAALGVWALFAPGDDGWVLIAALFFVVEGGLAVASSVRAVRAA